MKYHLSLVLAALLAACSQPEDPKTELARLKTEYNALGQRIRELELAVATSDSTSKPGKQVVAEALKPAPFFHYIETQAGVEAEENIMVSSRAAGTITHVHVREGETVRSGQVLAQVDNSLTQKAIAEVQGSLDLARTVFERQKSLWDQKIGTEIQFLTARNNKESLEKRLASLQEQDDLSRIRSAINGTVDDVMIKVGETTGPGAPAFRIVNTRKLKVNASLSEMYINDVRAGSPASVSLGGGAAEFKGKVSFTGKNINPLSRSFSVEIPVPSTIDARPGMSARVRIDFKELPAALSVPVNLVQKLNGEQVVYIAVREGSDWVARRRVVTVGGVFDNRAEILSGLTAGDRIITVAYQGLNDGEVLQLPASSNK